MFQTEIGKEEALPYAAELIRRGEIVAFPTETVYGLGANAYNESAVEKIFIAKNRPNDNPLIVHLADIADAEDFVYIDETSKMLFNTFSPGPFTIVLKKKPIIPDCVTAKLDTVGIRIPNHPMARAFIKECGCPIAAPSANRSTYVSPTTAMHVYQDMQGKIPLILDGGSCEVGIESTILDMTQETPTILRPGGITAEMLLNVLPTVRKHTGAIKVAKAPGMKYRHYAPNAECVLAESVEAAQREYDHTKIEKKPVVVGREGFIKGIKGNTLSLGETLADMSRNVYAALREAEKDYDYIILEEVSRDGLGDGIMNRLFKTTEKNHNQ